MTGPACRALGVMLWLSLPACGGSPSDAPPIPLEAKLTRQFALYDSARALLSERAAGGGGAYSRRAWEKLLRPPPEYRLTREDAAALRRDQRRRIEEAARRAVLASAIDLEVVRSRRLVGELLERLKLDLDAFERTWTRRVGQSGH